MFFLAYGIRCRPDVARSIKFMRFLAAKNILGFVVLANNMQTTVFRGKRNTFSGARPTSMLISYTGALKRGSHKREH